MYEETQGKLRNYNNARVAPSADLATWAETHGMLPEHVNSIADIGAAQGTVVAWLGQRYPEASILALDTDRRSTQFINAKLKNNENILPNPERVHAFTGTLEHAFAKKKCFENSVELVNMQAVAPYLSDEELTETLANIHKALVPGGKLMISCYGEHHFLDESKRSINLRTDLQMCGLLHDAGFLVECVGNKLDNGKPEGASEKTCYEIRDVGSTSLPRYSENEKYWHTVNIVASAYK